jgi:type IV pilus assembly protein PilN
MAKVNLLPWRAERRRVRQQEFYYLLGGAFVVAIVLGLSGIFFYSAQIDGQNDRNNYLNAEITKLDDQIKQIAELDKEKDKLLRRKEVIEQLQSNRSQMVHLFDELVRTIPEGVRLTAVKQDGNKLTLEGLSQSNARVSAYMRNIEASGWMTNPDLSVIQVFGDDKKLPYAFNLSLTLIRPGQVVGPDGQPVMGIDGKPLMTPAPGSAASPASTTPAPAASPAAAPAASSKGGATP